MVDEVQLGERTERVGSREELGDTSVDLNGEPWLQFRGRAGVSTGIKRND
jgi:hypothetical protein